MEENQILGFSSDYGMINIEVEENMPLEEADDGVVFATDSKNKTVVAKAAMKFEEVSETVKKVSNSLVDSIAGMAKKPQEVEVEFSIKVGGESGVFVAKASAEANFKVKVKWVYKDQ